MAVLDKLPLVGSGSSSETSIPKDVDERVKRGRRAAMRDAPLRRVCLRFFRNDQYCWVNEKSQVSNLPTITYTTGGGKEPHRVRTTRNLVKGIIEAKTSQATNATPGYEISPTSTDPSSASAAKTAQKVAVYGYEKWGLRKARVKAVENALIMDGGFVMPYFDPNVGPYVKQPDGSSVGYGEIKLRVFNGSQVAWEPGVDFEDSPWWSVTEARAIPEIEQTEGFTGGSLKPDAKTGDAPTDRPSEDMALVTTYFERPSSKTPRGRKLTFANKRQIFPKEDFPLQTPDGEICDEPVLHHLVYTIDPDADRGMGIMEHLLDAQRTLNDCVSKEIEWKNRCLNPQALVRKGALVNGAQIDDAPGRVHYIKNTVGPVSDNFKWQDTPPIPAELFTMADQAIAHMQAIAADPDTTTATSAAPGTLQAIAAQAAARWTTFLAALAEFDAAVMRHCLYLVARFYTEPRLLELKGRWDWDSIQDFRGTDLLGQCSVRVDMSSLQPQTRDQTKQDIQFWQTFYPGTVPPESAMAAYYGGVAENMILDYRLDIARANEIIRTIRAGEPAVFQAPMEQRIDPETGAVEEVPWWMPGPSDNVRVWKQMVGSWMKTDEYRQLIPPLKSATQEIYNGLLKLEMSQAARQQAMQTQMAEQLGRANAAAPQGEPMPSMPTPAAANQPGGAGANGNGAAAAT